MNNPAMTTPTARYDLHLHTHWSYDATANPRRYFEAARRQGLRCIAITDHHVLDSLGEVDAIAKDFPDIRAVAAAELTVKTRLGTFDLLCYGFPRKRSGDLDKVLDAYHAWQREYGAAVCAGVRALGHDFTDAHWHDLLHSYRPAEALAVQGATHVKNEVLRGYFVKRGFIASPEDYGPLLRRAQNAVPFPPYPAVSAVVPAVKAGGARVAIAHPYGYFAGCDEARMDAIRAECGLDGIECAHPGVPVEYTQRYRAYCERHGLFSVGGSDCHADDEIAKNFAVHVGPEHWLDAFLDRLG